MFPWLRLKTGSGTATPTPHECGTLAVDRRVVLEGVRLIEDEEVGVSVGQGELDVGLGAAEPEPVGDQVGPRAQGQPQQGVERGRRARGVVERCRGPGAAPTRPGAPGARRRGCGRSARRLLLGLRQRDLGGLALDLEPEVSRPGPPSPWAVSPRLVCQVVEAGAGLADGLAGGQDVDELGVEVIELEPDGVLILRLDHPGGPAGDERPRLALAGHVERVGDVQVVLRLPARPVRRETAVGDGLDVGVKDRVGAEAGGEDVGLGLGDLERLGIEVEVLADQPVDGLVEGQAVGRALIVTRRRAGRASRRARRAGSGRGRGA